jgi:hypothetical protein
MQSFQHPTISNSLLKAISLGWIFLRGRKMKQPFSSQEKYYVNQICLQEIIELRGKANRLLNYLGLPSPWMGDIVAWRPYIGQVFAVEMEERFIPDLVDKAYTLDLLFKLRYYIGNIDSILQTGIDSYGRSLDKAFPVDLVNLDYCGALVYAGFERIAALEHLFINQSRGLLANRGQIKFPYFLLLITHSSGTNDGKQRIGKEYIAHIVRDENIYQETIRPKVKLAKDWYLSNQCPIGYRHKVFVLGKVLEFAEARGFRVVPQVAIAYTGDYGKPMMHYQFKIYPDNVGSPVPSNSKISPLDILDWPVINISGQDVAEARPIIRSM